MARAARMEPWDVRPLVEHIGLDKVIKQIGEQAVIEQIGKRKLVHEIGLDGILANLTPAERRELRRRLEAEAGKS